MKKSNISILHYVIVVAIATISLVLSIGMLFATRALEEAQAQSYPPKTNVSK